MKNRPWKWIILGIPAAILMLGLVATVTERHRERQTQAVHAKAAFGPTEIWAAASPGRGLMEMLQPTARNQAIQKTVGLDMAEAPEPVAPPPPPPGPATPSLKLIRTGRVSVEVPDFEKAVRELGTIVTAAGGYLADTQVQRSPSGTRSGQVTLRVPAGAYESVGSRIRTLGQVQSEMSNVQDVTKAYADLETRLRVKREALTRIRELLRTRAGNLKDVLEAEEEITRITEEIEQAEGERRFFDHQVQLSTIIAHLDEPEPLSLARPSSWSALAESFRDAASLLASSLAFLLRVVVVLLPWGALAGAITWAVRWMRRRRKATQPCPGPDLPPADPTA